MPLTPNTARESPAFAAMMCVGVTQIVTCKPLWVNFHRTCDGAYSKDTHQTSSIPHAHGQKVIIGPARQPFVTDVGDQADPVAFAARVNQCEPCNRVVGGA
eukprot:1995138-Rhodomonas_salina.2